MPSEEAVGRELPLTGVRVVDFSRILAGPLVTQTLAEFGASVIKIEHPDHGDDTRSWGPPFWGEVATYFTAVNKGKQSIALDLRDDADSALAVRLIEQADVVVENFRPGVMERFGFDYNRVSELNSRLVYCSISGFGREGDGADLPGIDLLIQAMAGWMHVTGQADGPPTKVGMAVADVVAGLYATVGVLAALAERSATGRGRQVEVSLFESALAGLVNLGSGFLLSGSDHHREGNRHPSIAPYEPVQASDRAFVLAAVNDSLFARTCDVIGRPDLPSDPRFRTNPDRRRNADELIPELDRSFGTRPAREWIRRLRTAGIPAGELNTVGEAFEFAEQLGLDIVGRVGKGGFAGVRSPVRFGGSPRLDLAPPPTLDADGHELRRRMDAGLPPEEWWDLGSRTD
jgi:crotonobetainyl-CoA:carnitine CoA-transferase CaiB-like acyl-CoA transferase